MKTYNIDRIFRNVFIAHNSDEDVSEDKFRKITARRYSNFIYRLIKNETSIDMPNLIIKNSYDVSNRQLTIALFENETDENPIIIFTSFINRYITDDENVLTLFIETMYKIIEYILNGECRKI